MTWKDSDFLGIRCAGVLTAGVVACFLSSVGQPVVAPLVLLLLLFVILTGLCVSVLHRCFAFSAAACFMCVCLRACRVFFGRFRDVSPTLYGCRL